MITCRVSQMTITTLLPCHGVIAGATLEKRVDTSLRVEQKRVSYICSDIQVQVRFPIQHNFLLCPILSALQMFFLSTLLQPLRAVKMQTLPSKFMMQMKQPFENSSKCRIFPATTESLLSPLHITDTCLSLPCCVPV